MNYYDVRDVLLDMGFSCRPNFGLPYDMVHQLREIRGVADKELYLLPISSGIVVKILPVSCPYQHTETLDILYTEGIRKMGSRLVYEEDDRIMSMIQKGRPLVYPEREAIVGISLTEEILLKGISSNITAVYTILYCPRSYTTPYIAGEYRSSCTLECLSVSDSIPTGRLLTGYRDHKYSDATIIMASEKLDYDLHDILIKLQDDPIIDAIVLSCTFQIFYTLWKLRQVYGIFKHNDLGPGNILVQKVPYDTIITYDRYHIPTYGYVVKIWDFDKVDMPDWWWEEKKDIYPWLHIHTSIGDTPPDEIQYSEKILEIVPSPCLSYLLESYTDTGDVMVDADSIFDTFLSIVYINGTDMYCKTDTS